MTGLADGDPFDPGVLPAVVAHYLDSHSQDGARTHLLDLFTPDARVVDDGVTYTGAAEIRGWLSTTASEYHYTSTPRAQRSLGDAGWVVTVRLEGDFPGGVVDLGYRFETRDDLIADLVIAP